MGVITDITGKEIFVGDTVAYATRQSSNLELVVGVVREVKQARDWRGDYTDAVKLLVEPTHSSKSWRFKRSSWHTPVKRVTLSKLDRLVKVTA